MRALILLAFIYLAASLDAGLSHALRLPDATGVAPSFMLILAVFIALSAPGMTVAWTCLLIGLIVDLISPLPAPDRVSDIVIVGPAAVGFFLGGYITTQLRGVVFRDSPLTLAVMVIVAGIFVNLAMVALLRMRGLPLPLDQPLPNWRATDELVRAFFQLLYSAVVAVPVGFVLFRIEAVFGFLKPAVTPGSAGSPTRR